MKKVLISSLMLAAGLMVGCSKDADFGQYPEDNNASNITVRGTIVTDGSRVIVGEYTPGAETVPVYWTSEDLINLALINSETGALITEGGGLVAKRFGGLWQATTKEPAQSTYFKNLTGYMKDNVEGQSYIAFQSNALNSNSASVSNFKSVTTAYKKDQNYDTKTGRTDGNILVAASDASAEDGTIDLQFCNSLATIMVGIQGSAKVSSFTIAADDDVVLGYQSATLDMMNAPEAGSSFADITAEGAYIKGNGESNEINVVFSQTLALNEDTVWIPVTVMPIDDLAGTEFTVTFKGMDKDNAEKTVERTITVPEGAKDLTTNGLAYLRFKDITWEDLDQKEPKDEWNPGDVVLEEDFAWAKNDTQAAYGLVGDASITLPDLGRQSTSFSVNPNAYGYAGNTSSLVGFNSYDGFLSTGYNVYIKAGTLEYPLSDLGSDAVDLTITFKAMKVSKFDGTDIAENSFIYVSVGDGENNIGEMKQSTADLAPFTWYDFTFLVKGATRDMAVTFGNDAAPDSSNPDNAYYLFNFDEVTIKITEDADKEDLTGTKSTDEVHAASGAVTADKANYIAAGTEVAAEGETTVEVNISALGNSPITSTTYTLPEGLQSIYFEVPGIWTLEVPEEAKSWLQVVGPTYDFYCKGTPWFADAKGNQLYTEYILNPIENGGSAERSTTLTLKSGDKVLATYTVKQAALGTKQNYFDATFGTKTIAAESGYEIFTKELTYEDLGTSADLFNRFLFPVNDEEKNPGLALSAEKIDATAEGVAANYLYFVKGYAGTTSVLANNADLKSSGTGVNPNPGGGGPVVGPVRPSSVESYIEIGDGGIELPPMGGGDDGDDEGDDEGDDNGDTEEVTAVDPAIIIDLGMTIASKKYLFVEFDLYNEEYLGAFNMEVMFGNETKYGTTGYSVPGTDTERNFSISQSYGKAWTHNKLYFEVPANTQTCRIALYSYSSSPYSLADGNYYLDNLKVYAY